LEAALAARDITIDFSRLGTHTKQINRTVAFWNATVQGMDKMRRQFTSDPKGAITRTTLSVTLPSVVLYFANRKDPRYQELPQWQKDLFWIIPTKEHLIRIPKPFELGILFGTVPERVLTWIDQKDPKALDDLGKTILEAGMPGYLPTALLPIIENQSNYSFFTQRPIVPQREQRLEAKQQYGPNTTELAKAVGGAVNASPRKVENFIQGYSGGLGMYGARALDAPLEAIRYNLFGEVPTPKPAKTLAQKPVLKAFMAEPYNGAQSVDEFYKELNELEQQYNTVNQTGGKLPSGFNMARLRMLQKVDRQFSDIRKKIRQIQDNKALTPERKQAELKRLNLVMVNLARRAQGLQAVGQ